MFDRVLKFKRTSSAYKKLFLDEQGQIKPEAETVLKDLFGFTRFYKSIPADPQALAVAEGGRQVVRHILKRTGSTEQELNRHINSTVLGDDNE